MSPVVLIPADREARLDHCVAEPLGQARADDELGAGLRRGAQLARVEHGAGADDRARHSLHFSNRIERRGRAQGHLEHGQPTRDQGLGNRPRILDPVDDQHGDDGGEAHEAVDLAHRIKA